MNADVLIIGAGPAGLQAAIHSSRKKASTIVVGKPSNSAIHDSHMENYLGIERTSGKEFLGNGVKQAMAFGCQMLPLNVMSVSKDGGMFKAVMENGDEITSKSVILATGIARRKLNIPGEREFLGRGVSYCATCDCNFYKGATVAITGGESEAAKSADLMTRYASKVYWISKDMDVDKKLIENTINNGVIIIKEDVTQIIGDTEVKSISLSNGDSVNINGLFIELGGKSSVDIAMDLGVIPEIDDSIKVNGMCETSIPGVFACGDVTGKPWQVSKAVGQGSIAGMSAAEHSKERQQ